MDSLLAVSCLMYLIALMVLSDIRRNLDGCQLKVAESVVIGLTFVVLATWLLHQYLS